MLSQCRCKIVTFILAVSIVDLRQCFKCLCWGGGGMEEGRTAKSIFTKQHFMVD